MQEKIKKINDKLEAQGAAIIQVKQLGSETTYGYKPQAVFDAVNEIIGHENWRYKLHFIEPSEHKYVVKVQGKPVEKILKQVIAKVSVYFKIGDKWVTKGPHFGQSPIVLGNFGDAAKGAITDALQKGMSLWSIGTLAYRGDLGQFLTNNNNRQNGSSLTKETDSDGLPTIGNVTYEKRGGIIVAKGKTYGRGDTLKAAGFRWDGTKKYWWKEAA